MLNRLWSALTPHNNQDVLPMWEPDYPLCSSVVTVVHWYITTKSSSLLYLVNVVEHFLKSEWNDARLHSIASHCICLPTRGLAIGKDGSCMYTCNSSNTQYKLSFRNGIQRFWLHCHDCCHALTQTLKDWTDVFAFPWVDKGPQRFRLLHHDCYRADTLPSHWSRVPYRGGDLHPPK